MWKNIVEPVMPQMTIRRMRIACWIPKATNTYTEYVILIAFPVHKWLHERASMLRYAYIACLVYFSVILRDLNLRNSGRVSVKSSDYRYPSPTSVLPSADLGVGCKK
jgi:hypothetical protein